MAGLLQAAAALVPDALEHDTPGAAALLTAAPLQELAAGGQLHGVVTGALSISIADTAGYMCCRIQIAQVQSYQASAHSSVELLAANHISCCSRWELLAWQKT